MTTCPTTGYPYRIPVHPQPGFFETTVVTHEFEDGKGYTYGPGDYARQREMEFATPEILRDHAVEAMLDGGWCTEWVTGGENREAISGVLMVPPSPEVRAEMARLDQQNAEAGDGDDVPNPSPGRQAVKVAAKRTPAKKTVASRNVNRNVDNGGVKG